MTLILLTLAACVGSIDQVSTDPGSSTDGSSGTDGNDNGSNETDTVYLVAGKTATWSNHKVTDIRDLEEVNYTLSGPEDADPGVTISQLDLTVGTWTTSYAYELGPFTFTGDVSKNMVNETDFTGELDHVSGLDGIEMTCYDSRRDDTITTTIEDIDGDSSNIEANGIAVGNDAFEANGPLLTTDYGLAILGDSSLNFQYDVGTGPNYFECTF